MEKAAFTYRLDNSGNKVMTSKVMKGENANKLFKSFNGFDEVNETYSMCQPIDSLWFGDAEILKD